MRQVWGQVGMSTLLHRGHAGGPRELSRPQLCHLAAWVKKPDGDPRGVSSPGRKSGVSGLANGTSLSSRSWPEPVSPSALPSSSSGVVGGHANGDCPCGTVLRAGSTELGSVQQRV